MDTNTNVILRAVLVAARTLAIAIPLSFVALAIASF